VRRESVSGENFFSRADRMLPDGRPRILLAVLAVVLAVSAAGAVTVLGFSTAEAVGKERAGQEATAAVLDLTPKLLNFDYKTIDADMARAQSVTTGDYWTQNALGQTLKPAVIEQQASTTTVVRAGGVADAQPDKVVVLVFLNQTTTGKGLSAPRVDSRAARVTAARVDGTWLLAGFEPL
jgi:Mce-associated membrane protein